MGIRFPSDCVNRGLIVSLLSVMFGGLFFGGQIGISAVVQVWQKEMANCSAFLTESACTSTSTPILPGHATSHCLWLGGHNTCAFPDRVNCSVYNSDGFLTAFQDSADVDASCVKQHGWYVHRAGWSPTQIGLFSALVAVASFVSGPLGYFITQRYGRLWLIVVTGSIAVIAALATSMGFMFGSFPAILFSRVISGLAMGLICTACPTLVGAVCPEQHRRNVVAQFQIFATVGILGIAAAGYGAQVATDMATATDVAWRFQAVLAFSLLFGFLLLLTGILGKCLLSSADFAEVPTADNEDSSSGPEEAGIADDEKTPLVDASNSQQVQDQLEERREIQAPSLGSQIAATVSLPFCQQLGGINSMMTYAPIIASTIGVNPLQGNFILMAFNCLASIVAMPINRRSGFRASFLAGVAGCAVCDLTLGLMLTPGVVDKATQRVCCAVFAIVFISSFELGMGIPYWPLTTRAMLPPHRDKGIATVLVIEGVLFFVTNFTYPIIASSGDSLGQALAFYFFAAVSIVGFLILYRYLSPHSEYG